MSNLFEAAENKKSNAVEFTVSEISGALKRTVEDAFGNVRVRGEISGYRGAHASGHAYFALKDDKARLEAVIWRGVMGKLRFQPEEGMEVIATGKLTTYPGSSKYQIVIDGLEPAGAGALMALLEERKKRLGAEGLFDDARKKNLPFMPKVIGVVTSPTGAVIRDIIHRISDRFPLRVIVWPVRVQGETCGREVANGIAGFNALPDDGAIAKPDVLIVARGGGSLEDLWGFNDEVVVRAVAQSQIPVISAVGHETDWTLIDYVSDRRAPTPTGAAEMAVPVRAELEATTASLNARLKAGLTRLLDYRRQRLQGAVRALPSADQLLALPRRRFDESASRLHRALATFVNQKRLRFGAFDQRLTPNMIMRSIRQKGDIFTSLGRRLNAEPLARKALNSRQAMTALERRADIAFIRIAEHKKQRLGELSRLIKTLSYESVLERGFALVLNDQNQPIKRANAIHAGNALQLRFADGNVAVTANGGGGGYMPTPPPPATLKPKAPAKAKASKNPNDDSDKQGSLF